MSDADARNCLKQQQVPYGLTELDWNTLIERLLAVPESNYILWDKCEPPELSVYTTHFYKLDIFVGNNKNFYTNWVNAAKAYRFAMHLYDKYTFDDEAEMAPKAAIASGRATCNSWGTFIIDDGEKANDSMLALRDTIKTFFASHE